MGAHAFAYLEKAKLDCEWIDLAELDLPLCDANACYAHSSARKLDMAVSAAQGIIVAAPVYNYDVSASAKNMIELTGSSWEDKIVGFLCAAGGMTSYMSVMAYANSLMLDFRCVVIPRFVYATGAAFSEGEISDQTIIDRIEQVARELVRFTAALRG
jgi:FMN reductase